MLNIKKIRTSRGLTQKELADKLNINRSRISQWEIGYSLPRVTELPKIAKALKCSIEDFYT